LSGALSSLLHLPVVSGYLFGNVYIGNELSATLLALVFFILLSGTEGKSIDRQVDVCGLELRSG
jgi:hypothetical protein